MTVKNNICHVLVDAVSLPEAVAAVDHLVSRREPSYVVTPNADHIVQWQEDAEFRDCYADAALVLPDGMPLVWAGKFLGQPFKERVAGSDLFFEACALAAQKNYRVFLLGGKKGAAEEAALRLKTRFPGLTIAGTYCPPMGFEKDARENAKVLEAVRAARPDILLVGLGAPKQEKWIRRHYRQLEVPVSLAVGAGIDFAAGAVKRAPAWMQKTGLEWLWRLCLEPARLWKRYLVRDMQFFWLALRQKIEERNHGMQT